MPEPFLFSVGITVAKWTRYQPRRPRKIDRAAFATIKRDPVAFRQDWRAYVSDWVRAEIGPNLAWIVVGIAGWVWVSRCDFDASDEWTCLLIAWGALAASVAGLFSTLSLVIAAAKSRQAGDALVDAVMRSRDFGGLPAQLGAARLTDITIIREAGEAGPPSGPASTTAAGSATVAQSQTARPLRSRGMAGWFLGSAGAIAIVAIVAFELANRVTQEPGRDRLAVGDSFDSSLVTDTGFTSPSDSNQLAEFDSLWNGAIRQPRSTLPENDPLGLFPGEAGEGHLPGPVRAPAATPAQRRDIPGWPRDVPPLRYDWEHSAVASTDSPRARYLRRWLDTLNIKLQPVLRVSAPIRVTHSRCGRPGRDEYRTATLSILLCEETLEWFTELVDAGMGSTSARRMEVEALWFILGHELAHAIVETGDIPLVGDMEIAVDELSGLMLLESGLSLGGGRMFLHALAENEDEDATLTYHGSSRQRANRLDCLIAGKDFEEFGPHYSDDPELQRLRGIHRLSLGSSERLRECENGYPAIRRKWSRLLGWRWLGRS